MVDEYERAAEEVRRLFEEKASKLVEEIVASVAAEKLDCHEAKEALLYFISKWRDLVRPSLVSLACEAVGGDPSLAAPIGKALSLLSGATDIHDDIIDKTTDKEEGPTILGKFGVDLALMAGDALIFKGFQELVEGLAKLSIPFERKLAIVRVVKELYFEMFDGEALELRFRGRTDVKPEEYLEVVRKKAADVEACTRVGAMLGGGSEEQVEAFARYGRLLGMIVLLRNDLEDLLDFDTRLNQRIKNESLPLPLIYALENKEKRMEILSILEEEEIKRWDAKKLFTLVLETGGLDKLWKILNDFKTQAKTNVIVQKEKEKLQTIIEATCPHVLP